MVFFYTDQLNFLYCIDLSFYFYYIFTNCFCKISLARGYTAWWFIEYSILILIQKYAVSDILLLFWYIAYLNKKCLKFMTWYLQTMVSIPFPLLLQKKWINKRALQIVKNESICHDTLIYMKKHQHKNDRMKKDLKITKNTCWCLIFMYWCFLKKVMLSAKSKYQQISF